MLEICEAKDLAEDMVVVDVDEVDIQGFNRSMVGDLTEEDVNNMDTCLVKSVKNFGFGSVRVKMIQEFSGDKLKFDVNSDHEYLVISR